MVRKYRQFLFISAAIILFLTGCGADIDRTITVYRNEVWDANIEFRVPAEVVTLLGSPAEFEQELIKTAEEWESLGADVSWESSREDTIFVYTFHVKGEGVNTLQEVAFDSEAQFDVSEVNGERQIHFSQLVTGDLLNANSNTLTLRGGRVISSNGKQLDDSTVQWINPSGRIEAVFTEKSRINIGTILLVVVLGAVIGGGSWFFLQQRNHRLVQPTNCTNCGTSLNPQAKFCPKCGQQQA